MLTKTIDHNQHNTYQGRWDEQNSAAPHDYIAHLYTSGPSLHNFLHQIKSRSQVPLYLL